MKTRRNFLTTGTVGAIALAVGIKPALSAVANQRSDADAERWNYYINLFDGMIAALKKGKFESSGELIKYWNVYIPVKMREEYEQLCMKVPHYFLYHAHGKAVTELNNLLRSDIVLYKQGDDTLKIGCHHYE